MSWLKRAWWWVQDKIDPPCDHPVEARRPSIIRHFSTDTPTPAWTCRQCGNTVRVTLQEFYALFGRMPWESATEVKA